MTAQPQRPLHAVPSIEETQAKLGALVVLKNAARAAFDQAVALPRGALGWVMHQARTLIGQVTTRPVLSRAVDLARHASSAIRAVGVIPIVVAVASTPVVRQRLQAATAWIGSRLATVAGSVWGRAAAFLSRFPLGQTVTRSAVQAAGTIRDTTVNVLAHPAAVALTRGVREAVTAARPISVAVIAHRVAAMVAPSGWMRVALQIAVIPAILGALLNATPELSVSPVDFGSGSSDITMARVPEGVEPSREMGREAALKASVESRESDMAQGVHPSIAVTAADVDDEAAAHQPGWVPMNRAERRAQQRADARAQRAQQSTRHVGARV